MFKKLLYESDCIGKIALHGCILIILKHVFNKNMTKIFFFLISRFICRVRNGMRESITSQLSKQFAVLRRCIFSLVSYLRFKKNVYANIDYIVFKTHTVK